MGCRSRIPCPEAGIWGATPFADRGDAQWNVGALKRFTLSERWSADFRADASNLFNHRSFGNPISTMNEPNFGTNQPNPPSRSILLSLKLRF
jgi:hypothetical protein